MPATSWRGGAPVAEVHLQDKEPVGVWVIRSLQHDADAERDLLELLERGEPCFAVAKLRLRRGEPGVLRNASGRRGTWRRGTWHGLPFLAHATGASCGGTIVIASHGQTFSQSQHPMHFG